MARPCLTSIYIVCEGSASEPWFLRRFAEAVKSRCEIGYSVEIFPAPSDEKSGQDSPGRKTGQRKLQGAAAEADPAEGESPKGGNPLYWVMHGVEKLSAFSEVYAVFDKDGHPKMAEAFALASQGLPDGRKVGIIFNSRSFEYYMLMHFERIFRAFAQTECGEKRGGHTRYFHCCLPNAVAGKECGGTICINGYARSRGYWKDSKDRLTFLTATNFWRGMSNAEYVRTKSIADNPDEEIYNLNPYVDFQSLLTRLMEYKILKQGEAIAHDCGRSEQQRLKLAGNVLSLHNGSSVLNLKLDEGWIKYCTFPSESVKFDEFSKDYASVELAEEAYAISQFAKTEVKSESAMSIAPGEEATVELAELAQPNSFAIIHIWGARYLIF